MQQGAWKQKSIKMTPHKSDKITTGKVTLKKANDTWEISLSAFWTRPTKAQMFIVGTSARKVLDIDASDGSYYASRKLSDINWNDFIYSAKMIVVIADNIPVLTANIPSLSNVDVHSAMTIIRCNEPGETKEITKDEKKQTVKKEVEQLAVREQIQLSKSTQDIKSLLTISPITRRKAPCHLKSTSATAAATNHALHTPLNWDICKMDESLKSNAIPSPFVGKFENAVFAKVEVANAYGFDHRIVCKVPVNKMHVYMLCIPGKAVMPPFGLTDFNRWIPAMAGNGYWVKYILNN